MAINRSPIVGVFDEQGSAEHAIEELYQAGIPSDRISYSGSHASATGGNFIESIKALFTGGHAKTAQDVVNDLNNMGLSNDEAQYYAQEFDAGRTLVAVQSDEQSQDALAILRSNGAHGYHGQWNRNSGDKFSDTTATNTGAGYTRYDAQQSTIQPDSQSTDYNQSSTAQDASSYATPGSVNTNEYNTTPGVNNSQAGDISDVDTQVLNRDSSPNTVTPSSTDARRPVNAYDLDANTPTYNGQQDYSDPNRSERGSNDPTDINRQGFTDPTRTTDNYNNPNQTVQQGSYVDPNRPANPYDQTANDPTYTNQAGYSDPSTSSLTGQQGYADPNRPLTTRSNQFDDRKSQTSRRIERSNSESNPDADYEGESRNSFDKDQL